MSPQRTRQRNRLQGYDYSQQGAYFITICTQNRAELFGHIVGANCVRPFTELSNIGQTVKREIETLAGVYPMVHVGEFVIMPNHVHMIILIDSGDDDQSQDRHLTDGRNIADGRTQFAPTVSRIVKQWKGAVTKRVGFSLWQKSFHDHVIRNQDDYRRVAQYIENNPGQWQMDTLHPSQSPIGNP